MNNYLDRYFGLEGVQKNMRNCCLCRSDSGFYGPKVMKLCGLCLTRVELRDVGLKYGKEIPIRKGYCNICKIYNSVGYFNGYLICQYCNWVDKFISYERKINPNFKGKLSSQGSLPNVWLENGTYMKV